MTKRPPSIESYGPPEGAWWIRIRIGKRIYEYHAPHPRTITATRAIFRYSPWKALNHAKRTCRLARIDTDVNERQWPRKVTIMQVREVDPKVTPLDGLLALLNSTGCDVTYKFGKFFIYKLGF